MNSRQDHLIERAAARMRKQGSSGDVPPVVAGGLGDTRVEPLPDIVDAPQPAVPSGVSAPADTSTSGFAYDARAGASTSGDTPIGLSSHDAGAVSGHETGDTSVLAAPEAETLPALPDMLAPDLDLKTLEEAGLVVGRSTRTRISEEFRIAVARIAQMAEVGSPGAARNPIILVTSARPGEGKTFTTLNLAAVLAQNGPRRVVLVDTDFKQGSLSDLLKLGTRRGLFDLVDGAVSDPRLLTLTTAVRGLSVLPSGTYLSEAAGTGFSGPLAAKVAAVAAAFPDEIVVLDAPPCLSTSDPSTLAGVAGQVLLVVEAGRTQRTEVESALDFVRACPMVTLLLNKVRQSNRKTFGSYDYLSSYQ